MVNACYILQAASFNYPFVDFLAHEILFLVESNYEVQSGDFLPSKGVVS